jgi:hypothetical protein
MNSIKTLDDTTSKNPQSVSLLSSTETEQSVEDCNDDGDVDDDDDDDDDKGDEVGKDGENGGREKLDPSACNFSTSSSPESAVPSQSPNHYQKNDQQKPTNHQPTSIAGYILSLTTDDITTSRNEKTELKETLQKSKSFNLEENSATLINVEPRILSTSSPSPSSSGSILKRSGTQTPRPISASKIFEYLNVHISHFYINQY